MARYKQINDLYFTDHGDFFVGESGDLEDTRDFHLRGFIQKVFTRLKSKPGEWALQGGLGAGLDAFVGLPNTEEVAVRIKELVWRQITQDDLVRYNEAVVDVVPVGQSKVAIIIAVLNAPGVAGEVLLTFTYDLRDNRLIPRYVPEVI